MTPKCGVCGGEISNTLVPHGAICEDDIKAERMPYAPEKTVNDIMKEIAEGEGND